MTSVKLSRIVVVGLILLPLLILGAFLYHFSKPELKLVSTIPEVFQEQGVNFVFSNGSTQIVTEQEHVHIAIVHDEQALYILNGVTDEIRDFDIDYHAGEIVIAQNIMSPKLRNKPGFQLLTLEDREYRPIVHDGKLRVRLNYMYLSNQSTLLEYNLPTKDIALLEHTLVGK